MLTKKEKSYLQNIADGLYKLISQEPHGNGQLPLPMQPPEKGKNQDEFFRLNKKTGIFVQECRKTFGTKELFRNDATLEDLAYRNRVRLTGLILDSLDKRKIIHVLDFSVDKGNRKYITKFKFL